LNILIDTREQDLHIQRDLKKIGVSHEFKKLDFGDYSFVNDGVDYSKKIVIERKKNFDEIVSNLLKESRFYREFHYARKQGIKIVVFIEQTEDIIAPLETTAINPFECSHKKEISRATKKAYRSTLSKTEIKNMLEEFEYKYLVPIHLIKRDQATRFVIETFKNYRER
jgi:ERCC4-type nuclease